MLGPLCLFGTVLAFAFWLFPGFFPQLSPTLSAEQVAGFYRDNAGPIRASMIVFNLCEVMFIPFFMVTVPSWWLGADAPLRSRQTFVLSALSILAVAIVKCRLVIRNYMEVRFAPPWLQRACDAWLLLNFALVSSYYWLAG